MQNSLYFPFDYTIIGTVCSLNIDWCKKCSHVKKAFRMIYNKIMCMILIWFDTGVSLLCYTYKLYSKVLLYYSTSIKFIKGWPKLKILIIYFLHFMYEKYQIIYLYLKIPNCVSLNMTLFSLYR